MQSVKADAATQTCKPLSCTKCLPTSKLTEMNLVLIYKSAQVSTRFLLFFTFTTLGRNKVTPGHMWGRIFTEGPSSDLWKRLWAAGTASRLLACSSHSCTDRSGAALQTVTSRLLTPPCPLLVILIVWLIFNKAPHLHPYGLKVPIPSLHSQQAQPNFHAEAAPRHSRMGFPWAGSGAHPKPNPMEQWAFPHTVLSEDFSSSPVSLPPHQADRGVPRKCCPTLELQLVTTSMWASDISYYFHRSPGCESGIWAVNIIHKASWGCTDK